MESESLSLRRYFWQTVLRLARRAPHTPAAVAFSETELEALSERFRSSLDCCSDLGHIASLVQSDAQFLQDEEPMSINPWLPPPSIAPPAQVAY